MKKSIFLSIVGAIALAMTLVSCGNKSSETQDTIEPITGTDFSLVTTAKGELGIKKGEEFIITPKADYKSIEAVGGMFLAKLESGYSLLNPETGYSTIDADTIVWKDPYFEGKKGEIYLVYVPVCKLQFAANEYAVSGNKAIAVFNKKITAWIDGKEVVEPNGEYKKLILLSDGTFLALDGIWGTATATKDKLLQPGKAIPPKVFKKYEAMKGYKKDATVMILE